MRVKYLLSGLLLCLLGFFLIWQNSLGVYIDKFLSTRSSMKGHMSDWLVIIGGAFIVIGILALLMSFVKEKLPGNAAKLNL